ncbi:MAG TPA: DUF3488 and transglutaminase-like domain-containing protein [Candidatus Nanopelagicales bacterium]
MAADPRGPVRRLVARWARDSRWRLTVAAGAATMISALALQPLLAGGWWIGESLLVVLAIGLTGGIARALHLPAPLQPLVQAAVLLVVLTVRFAPQDAIGGVLPGPGALEDLRQLAADGRTYSEVTQAPAPEAVGLLLLVVAGIGLIALVVDTLSVGLDLPGLTLVAFASLFVVTWGINDDLAPGWAFVSVGVAWLTVLWAAQADWASRWGPQARPGAAGMGLLVGVGALVVALASGGLATLRGPSAPVTFGAGSGEGAVQVDALVSLRRSLVDNDLRVMLTYATTAARPDYLRLAVLDAFDGEQWQASAPPDLTAQPPLALGPGNALAPVDPTSLAPRSGQPVEYRMDVGPLAGSTLPSPAHTIASLNDWPVSWDQRTSLPVRSDGTSVQGSRISLVAAPPELDAEGLRRASTAPIPDEAVTAADSADPTPLVGEELATLAREVTAGADTPYDRAVALQRWFTSEGGFQYSTQVEGGASGDALDDFLTERVGYCEQFAATMALMARTVGIPSRVVVGFTQGRSEGGQWVVRGTDAHAWPELWMGAAGWTRFEPTPGAPTTITPAYTRPDNSAQSPSAGPSASASDVAPSAAERPDRANAPDAAVASTSSAALQWLRWLVALVVVVLLLLAPAGWRVARRRRRLGRGDPESAYREVVDTMIDLGLGVEASTPRETLHALRARVGGGAGGWSTERGPWAPGAGEAGWRQVSRGSDVSPPPAEVALDRVLRAVEWQRYGPGSSGGPSSPELAGRPGALAGDVATVRATLAEVAGRARTVRGQLLPVSLWPDRRGSAARQAAALDPVP